MKKYIKYLLTLLILGGGIAFTGHNVNADENIQNDSSKNQYFYDEGYHLTTITHYEPKIKGNEDQSFQDGVHKGMEERNKSKIDALNDATINKKRNIDSEHLAYSNMYKLVYKQAQIKMQKLRTKKINQLDNKADQLENKNAKLNKAIKNTKVNKFIKKYKKIILKNKKQIIKINKQIYNA